MQNVIKRAKEKHLKAKEKESEKQMSRPLTTKGLINHYHNLCIRYNYGRPSPLTKKDVGKVSGFIKVFKNNDYEDKDIYEIIEKCFSQWERLKESSIKTSNNKNYLLADYPNLRDIVNCRDSILSKLDEGEKNNDVEDWRDLF